MRILLLPIAFFYHIILIIRHKLYDWHLLKSKKYDVPVICVGNLALGGTGKTPHVEYLVELLTEQYRVCIISRGYGRKTKGFQLANGSCCTETIGDEPMQYVNNYDHVMVAVDESRNRAIELMNTMDQPPELYLLDDAFQHRSTQAGLNILLTAYDRPYYNDFLFPAGTLRDVRKAAKRADIIVVSKSPDDLNEVQKSEIREKLKPLHHQKVFFSSLVYEPLEAVNAAANKLVATDAQTVLLFCGIANPKPLIDRMKTQYKEVEILSFGDHHLYTENDVNRILDSAKKLPAEKKIVVTTEKDYARLTNSPYLCLFDSMPLFTAPVRVHFHEEEKFNNEITNYVRTNSQHG